MSEHTNLDSAVDIAIGVMRDLTALCDKHGIPVSVDALGVVLEGTIEVAATRARMLERWQEIAEAQHAALSALNDLLFGAGATMYRAQVQGALSAYQEAVRG